MRNRLAIVDKILKIAGKAAPVPCRGADLIDVESGLAVRAGNVGPAFREIVVVEFDPDTVHHLFNAID